MRLLIISLLAAAAASAVAAPVATPVSSITDPASIVSTANPGAKPVPLGDLGAVRGASGAAWSPDGKSLVVSTNLTGRFNLWRVDLGAHFPVQLTSSDQFQSVAAVTKDGQVLFTQDIDGDELDDLYAVPIGGGPIANLTRTPDYAESRPRLSPDQKLIALSRRAKTGAVIDLVLLDRRTGEARALTQEKDPSRLWFATAWSADGKTLFATRGNITDTEASIYRIDVGSGRATLIGKEAPGLYNFADDVSPDGRTIAVTSNEGTGQLHAGLMDVASGRTRWVAATPWEQLAFTFSPDGRSLLVQTNADGRSSLALADVKTLAMRPLDFPPGVTRPGNPDSPWRPGGGLLVSHDGGDAPPDFWLVDPAGGKPQQLTRLSVASLDRSGLPKSSIVAYRSSDGTPISAILTMPFNLKRDGSNPAIVIPHGGPTGQSTDGFSRQAVALASRGYMVIQPNFRGSTGYGKAFQDANQKDLGGGDLEDVVGAAKFLAATGYVDAKKIGITGGSYGGFMTLMALGKRPDVFAAGVSQFGIINWFTMWENSVGGLREYQRALVGDPVADKEAYLKQSPMTYVRNIKAPLLVLQGENDVRVPRGQSDEVVKLVKDQGGVVEAVYYPGEGHGFSRLENQHDARTRMIDWFDRHLKGAGR